MKCAVCKKESETWAHIKCLLLMQAVTFKHSAIDTRSN